MQAGVDEFGRLLQSCKGSKGLDVITFIRQSDVPANKPVTLARCVMDCRPKKDKPRRLHIARGGDKLDHHGNTTTHSATMEIIKCQLNDILSRPNGKCAAADISNVHLESHLVDSECVRFRVALIPKAIRDAHNIDDMATKDGHVCARVNKAWHGLE